MSKSKYKVVRQEGWTCPYCDSGQHTYCTDDRCHCKKRHHMSKVERVL